MRILVTKVRVITKWSKVSIFYCSEKKSLNEKMTADIPGFLYAGAVAAGGIMGYYKAGR